MNQPTTQTHPSIIDLPTIILGLYERAQKPLSTEIPGQVGLFVRYLRRKAERGLAVIYSVDSIRSRHTTHAKRSVSLTLDEKALEGARIRFTMDDVRQAVLEVLPSGVLEASALGLSVQAFPADSHLTALAASCDASTQGPVFATLQAAAHTQLHDQHWQLVSATAEPVRYKPGNRCVNRYHLTLHHADGSERTLTIFGKVYTDPQQAQTVQALQQQLYDEQTQHSDIPLLPRPLALIPSLGLAFNEAVQPISTDVTLDNTNDVWSSLRTGTRSLQPRFEHGKGGAIAHLVLPEKELRLTARALASLHTSRVQPPQNAPRTGAKEAKRALERARLIAGWNSKQADEVQRLAKELAERLTAAVPESYRPAHGGFKASQLLFHSHRVFVVDFDGFCLADPALDVGYFLAYLRPSGLWYAKQGACQWFKQAATLFRDTYREAMAAQGVAAATLDGILERSRLYEAALLFKIATRRVNRLNSPRPKELSVMLNEIAACLTGTAKGDE